MVDAVIIIAIINIILTQLKVFGNISLTAGELSTTKSTEKVIKVFCGVDYLMPRL